MIIKRDIPIKCLWCSKMFKNPEARRLHMRSFHKKRYPNRRTLRPKKKV